MPIVNGHLVKNDLEIRTQGELWHLLSEILKKKEHLVKDGIANSRIKVSMGAVFGECVQTWAQLPSSSSWC